MKKIIAVFLLISMIFCFSSCKNNPFDSDSNFLKKRGIALGDEVTSVEFTSKNGEKTTFCNTDDFYTILDKISVEYEYGKKYVIDAKIKLNDESASFINLDWYHYEDDYLQKYKINNEGDRNVALIDKYGTQGFNTRFERYTYKDEKAFLGVERQTGGGSRTEYSSSKYPKIPQTDTELGQMMFLAEDFDYFLGMANLFSYCEVPPTMGVDINELISVEYKLYENYIVLKQTAPFLTLYFPDVSYNEYIFYKQAEASGCSIIQEAYCNVETGEIELIRIYGDTTMHTLNRWGDKWEVDIKMYVYDIDEAEFKKEVDELIDYVKSNAD